VRQAVTSVLAPARVKRPRSTAVLNSSTRARRFLDRFSSGRQGKRQRRCLNEGRHRSARRLQRLSSLRGGCALWQGWPVRAALCPDAPGFSCDSNLCREAFLDDGAARLGEGDVTQNIAHHAAIGGHSALSLSRPHSYGSISARKSPREHSTADSRSTPKSACSFSTRSAFSHSTTATPTCCFRYAARLMLPRQPGVPPGASGTGLGTTAYAVRAGIDLTRTTEPLTALGLPARPAEQRPPLSPPPPPAAAASSRCFANQR